MHDNKTMFSYNVHDKRNEMISAFRAFSLEVLLILILVSAVLGVMNYFNIITMSNILPVFSFLPQRNQSSSITNTEENIGNDRLETTNSSTSGNLKKGNNRVNNSSEVQVVEISTTGGTVKSKNGLDVPYEIKLKVRDVQGTKTFYYEKKDISNIAVFEKKSGENKEIKFSDLKVGDTIYMDMSYDPITKNLFKLIITRK